MDKEIIVINGLEAIINYVTRKDKTNTDLITGKDCVANSCFEEMKSVKEFYKT